MLIDVYNSKKEICIVTYFYYRKKMHVCKFNVFANLILFL